VVTIVALWGLHFAASGRLMDRYVETTADPILAARRTVNGLLVSVAGLVAVAVGNELAIAHPQNQVSMALSLVRFGGPLLYLLSQTVYLWAVLGIRSLPRLAALAALVVAGACPTCFLPTQPSGSWSPSCSSWSSPSFVNGMRPHADSSRTGRPDLRTD
jgi:low temperature requirement protein LtrA